MLPHPVFVSYKPGAHRAHQKQIVIDNTELENEEEVTWDPGLESFKKPAHEVPQKGNT